MTALGRGLPRSHRPPRLDGTAADRGRVGATRCASGPVQLDRMANRRPPPRHWFVAAAAGVVARQPAAAGGRLRIAATASSEPHQFAGCSRSWCPHSPCSARRGGWLLHAGTALRSLTGWPVPAAQRIGSRCRGTAPDVHPWPRRSSLSSRVRRSPGGCTAVVGSRSPGSRACCRRATMIDLARRWGRSLAGAGRRQPLAPRLPGHSVPAARRSPCGPSGSSPYVLGFSHAAWFHAYPHGSWLSPVADQETATITLWAVAAACFVPVVYATMMVWLKDSDDPDDELRRVVDGPPRSAGVRGWERRRPPERSFRASARSDDTDAQSEKKAAAEASADTGRRRDDGGPWHRFDRRLSASRAGQAPAVGALRFHLAADRASGTAARPARGAVLLDRALRYHDRRRRPGRARRVAGQGRRRRAYPREDRRRLRRPFRGHRRFDQDRGGAAQSRPARAHRVRARSTLRRLGTSSCATSRGARTAGSSPTSRATSATRRRSRPSCSRPLASSTTGSSRPRW